MPLNKLRVDITGRFVILGLFLLLLATLLVIDPAASRQIPRCPFLSLTGLKCPGCGSLRAVHSILRGDLVRAWHFNSLAVVLLPAVLLSLLYNAFQNKDPVVALGFRWLGWGLTSVVLLWWLLRNIFLW